MIAFRNFELGSAFTHSQYAENLGRAVDSANEWIVRESVTVITVVEERNVFRVWYHAEDPGPHATLPKPASGEDTVAPQDDEGTSL